MSRKRRRKRVTAGNGGGKTSSAPKNNLPVLLSAFDGYSNTLAFLGEDSPLLSSGTYRRSGLTDNTELLTTAYRENWIAKRIIDMPCEDMTRAWYRLSTSLPEEALHALKRLEAKHSVKQEIANAIRWARLYGGALALMVIRGEEQRLDLPLDPDVLPPGCFQGLLVLDKAQGIEPSLELVKDLDDPDFGLPMFYFVDLEWGEEISRLRPRPGLSDRPGPSAGMLSDEVGSYPGYQRVKIHHSRVLRFIGRELPHMETVAENYWGASELEHIWDELQKRSATSANIAQLVFQANITTLKISHMADHLALGSDSQRRDVLNALAAENRLRTSFGLQVLNAEDSLENHNYNFAGLPDIYEAFMMDMAGAAEIPATKLFGRSPQGMNSTGEADLRNYYDMIAQMQERCLRPALEKLVPVMALSCWGYAPEDMEIIFEPVMTSSPAEKAELVQKMTSDVIEAFKAGLISREQAIAELESRGEPLGVYTKIRVES